MPITLAGLEEIVREAGSLAMRYFNDLNGLEINKKAAATLLPMRMWLLSIIYGMRLANNVRNTVFGARKADNPQIKTAAGLSIP